ncbi:DUF3618 domain-containing protein [Amnibacterium sp.]|jgi:hypothetical protein|uniref:DUF3618 domain-containing protein n=1 Tax=Amnibacterium sp. TaxID=1872496 RepID=UPI002617F602|nr:DUF3618 domain-containing protein [Amnibacterium sp.]MCU1473414.1 hypothetical protein [Amnibacterium sp.]
MTADGSDKDRALSEIRSDIEVTRQRLAQTLDEIEERLDVPKRVKKAVAEGRERFDTMREDNPALVYGVLGGAAAVVVGLGALVIRGARR